MITLYGKMLENFPNEKNLFDFEPASKEYLSFWKSTGVILKEIMKKHLNYNQKKLILLFLEGHHLYEISKILNRGHVTIYEKRSLIIKKLSIALINSRKFNLLINEQPETLKRRLIEWKTESRKKYKLKPSYCPCCNKKFKNIYEIKKHIFQINDKTHIKYYNDQLKFIHKKLRKDGFNVKWIYELEDKLLFSLSWIYNLWKKNYGHKFKKNL